MGGQRPTPVSRRWKRFISRKSGRTRALAGMIITIRVTLRSTLRPMNCVSANPYPASTAQPKAKTRPPIE